MIYGYASIDIKQDKKELAKQIKEIRKYARKLKQDVLIISDIVNDDNRLHNLTYRENLKVLLATVKKDDTVIFAKLDSIFPTNKGISAVLTHIYYHKANSIVLDFPAVQSININPFLERVTDPILLYSNIIDPLLIYRDYLLQQSNL